MGDNFAVGSFAVKRMRRLVTKAKEQVERHRDTRALPPDWLELQFLLRDFEDEVEALEREVKARTLGATFR